MTVRTSNTLIGISVLAICCAMMAGCGGKTDQTASPAPPPTPAQVQTRQQAALNNAHMSPAMKAAIERQMQRSQRNGQ